MFAQQIVVKMPQCTNFSGTTLYFLDVQLARGWQMYSSDYFPSDWQKFGEVDLTFPAVDSTAIRSHTSEKQAVAFQNDKGKQVAWI